MEEFRGQGIPYVKPAATVAWPAQEMAPVWQDDLCTGCGVCGENLCFAITMKDRKPNFVLEDCGGCGLCVAACAQGAISMQTAAR